MTASHALSQLSYSPQFDYRDLIIKCFPPVNNYFPANFPPSHRASRADRHPYFLMRSLVDKILTKYYIINKNTDTHYGCLLCPIDEYTGPYAGQI
jgi:hypothetical protein